MPPKKHTPKGLQYINNYNRENYDRLTIAVPKGTKEKWKAAAEERGVSVTKLIIDSVEKEIN